MLPLQYNQLAGGTAIITDNEFAKICLHLLRHVCISSTHKKTIGVRQKSLCALRYLLAVTLPEHMLSSTASKPTSDERHYPTPQKSPAVSAASSTLLEYDWSFH